MPVKLIVIVHEHFDEISKEMERCANLKVCVSSGVEIKNSIFFYTLYIYHKLIENSEKFYAFVQLFKTSI